jgi:hypothetical protein
MESPSRTANARSASVSSEGARPFAIDDTSSAASIGPDVARVDDPVVHTGELDTFSRLGIEVDSRDCSSRHRGADVPVSARRHSAQRLDGFHSANVGNSNCRASLLSPMARPLLAPALFLCGAASLPVRAAVLGRPLVVSAGETILIAAIVFGRTGDSRRGGERHDQGCRGNGDEGPHASPAGLPRQRREQRSCNGHTSPGSSRRRQ